MPWRLRLPSLRRRRQIRSHRLDALFFSIWVPSEVTGPTAVTLVGNMAYVSEARLNLRNDATKDPGPFRAVGVPYTAPK